jgi:hypothetical protein
MAIEWYGLMKDGLGVRVCPEVAHNKNYKFKQKMMKH